MTLKVGIVGMGNIGNIHAGVYKENPKTEIVAVCDIIREKADRAAEKYGAKAFYSVKEMLSSGILLDACSMATGKREWRRPFCSDNGIVRGRYTCSRRKTYF